MPEPMKCVCGRIPEHCTAELWSEEREYHVFCECGRAGPCEGMTTEEDAVSAWNKMQMVLECHAGIVQSLELIAGTAVDEETGEPITGLRREDMESLAVQALEHMRMVATQGIPMTTP